MYHIINSLPFQIYILILLAAIVGGVYGIFDMHKNRSGHPMIWSIPFGILECILLILYRCSFELTTNVFFQKLTEILAIMGVILFFTSLIVTFIIANKNNYINKKRLKELLPLMICCVIIILICFLSLVGT